MIDEKEGQLYSFTLFDTNRQVARVLCAGSKPEKEAWCSALLERLNKDRSDGTASSTEPPKSEMTDATKSRVEAGTTK